MFEQVVRLLLLDQVHPQSCPRVSEMALSPPQLHLKLSLQSGWLESALRRQQVFLLL